jgi:cytoskeletal protein CcmA (bactofilin family)
MLGKSNRDGDRFPDSRVSVSVSVKEAKKMVNDLATQPKDQNTFIAKGSEFVGKLTFEGTVRIDGKIEGEIFSKGTLVIGPGADIKAKINVDSVVISGNVKGNVTARKKVELRAPGKLYGNITTSSLMVEQGVIFEGACKMENLDFGKEETRPAPVMKSVEAPPPAPPASKDDSE